MLLLIAGLALPGFSCMLGPVAPAANNAEHTSPAPPSASLSADTLTFAIVGDLMVGSSYPDKMYLPPDSQANLFKAALPLLASADVRMGNLECALSDSAPVFKDCSGNMCYFFRTPFKYAAWYPESGFNYLNVANNHSFDFGSQGVQQTTSFLTAHHIRFSGILQHPFDTLTVRHTRIGFVSFAPHTNCLDLNDDSLVTAMLTNLRPLCNILVVFFHGGGEGANRLHTPDAHEIFLEQDRGYVRHFAHLCIDHGADIVIGSGPHVVRGMEIYKDKLAAYSLGNFATYHLFNLKYPRNIAPLLKVRFTSGGVLADHQVYSFIQEGEGVPAIDTAQQAYQLINRLSQEDFGYNGVKKGLYN